MRAAIISFVLLFAGVLLLTALVRWPVTDPEGAPVKAEVISSVITQSLDGNRYYVVVRIEEESLRVSSDPGIQCHRGDTALLQPLRNHLISEPGFKLLRCDNEE